jgi:signal recognition particle receptor subunit beta
MNETHKLLFIGEPGAGKTTCIAALSQIPPVVTDVGVTDDLARIKATTTVAFDYGELDLGDEGRLLLYGLPGQSRFKFMFDIVRDGLLGVVVLVDTASPDPIEGLRETLTTYAAEIRDLPCVLALNKTAHPSPRLVRQCQELLGEYSLVIPVMPVDARRRDDLALILDLFFAMLESDAASLASAGNGTSTGTFAALPPTTK